MEKLKPKLKTLLIITELTNKIGFREGIILQQVHYWLTKNFHIIKGRSWTYNTYKDWQLQFPFWCEATIKRTILNLEKQGLLISGNWNVLKLDKTKWYTIDYEKVAQLDLPLIGPEKESQEHSKKRTNKGPAQSYSITIASTGPDETASNPQSIDQALSHTQAIPEITSFKKEKPIVEILDYLNHKTDSAYKATTKKTRKVIRSRINEGFTLEDFKKVIDIKTSEWQDDPHWSKYLRPETLFGPKFESYLNQKAFKKKLTEEDLNLDD